MTTEEHYETLIKSYSTVSEMMVDINTMNTSGYELVYASNSNLKAHYKKLM